MGPPPIALRFRDTTPSVDTIESHREILRKNGSVWWGWWKKASEEISASAVARGLMDKPVDRVLLINRAARKCYISNLLKFSLLNEVDLEKIPAYYRSFVENVEGFFLLSSISDAPYNEALGDRMGERTFAWTSEVGLEAQSVPQIMAANAKQRSCVLHLSDLHFGSDYGFKVQGESIVPGDNRKTLTGALIDDLLRLHLKDDIAAVIVSGDFMSKGDWNDRARTAALDEFSALRRELNLEKSQIIAVPGNHDIVRYPEGAQIDLANIVIGNQTSYRHEREYRTFVEELVERKWREALNYVVRVELSEVDLLLCVMNSCTITSTQWTEYGFVGPNGIDALRQLARERRLRPSYRFLALHHHLLPVADVEAPQSRGVTLTLDASEILSHAQKAGVHIVLHGHQHKPKISVYQDLPLGEEAIGAPMHVVANGSAGAKSSCLPPSERNTYCVFRLNANGIKLWMRELRLDGRAGAALYCGVLDKTPA